MNLLSVPALLLAGMLAFHPAIAEKGGGGKSDRSERSDKGGGRSDRADRSEKGGGKSDRDEHRADKGDKGGSERADRREHFESRHNVLVRDYYDSHYHGGRCPPGLAKKHNGCMPPGQAKKWEMGHQLPRNVTYYSVPSQLVTQIGPPPAGYRYIRVGNDILLISSSTRTILDAILNFGRS